MSDILSQLQKTVRYEQRIKEQDALIERQRKEIALLHARLSAADVQLRRVARDMHA